MSKYFTVGNPKTVKGESLGYLTHILHLAPADSSGYEVCPGRSSGCTELCLNHAGRGRFAQTQMARIRRTLDFFERRGQFLADIVKDIRAGIRAAERRGLTPAFRLNGTSDIRWELYGIMSLFPTVQFYDYTKLSNRKNIPSNYHLTFSLSEDNEKAALEALENGMNVAVVFGVKKGHPLPATYLGRPVIDGDEHDLRFLDPKGVIVGLRIKGDKKTKNSTSEFIVKVG